MAALRFPVIEGDLEREPAVYGKFYAILFESVQPSSTTSVHETCDRILSHLPRGNPKSVAAISLFELMVDFVPEVPYTHPSAIKLVDIFTQLLVSPDWCDPALDESTRYGDFATFAYDFLFNAPENTAASVNGQAFLARYYARESPEYVNMVVMLLRSAFESGALYLDRRESSAKYAAVWIIFHGHNLFNFIQNASPDARSEWRGGDRYRATLEDNEDRNLLTNKRWQFWKRGFDQLASGTLKVDGGREAYNKCKKLCRQAFCKMQEIEESQHGSAGRCM